MDGTTLLPAPLPLGDLLAQKPIALFLDFDGTLIEIAPRPGDIHVPDGLPEHLQILGDRLGGRLALVSGRALDDLAAHLGEVGICRAGSHGASRLLGDGTRLGEEPRGLADGAIAELRAYAEENGLFYEAKAHGGALHFRGQPEKQEAALAFASDFAGSRGLSVTKGKGVVELVQPGATKAGAVEAFMKMSPFAGAMPVFVGDDVTDEDGFAGAEKYGGFGIAVGERPSQRARYHLDNVAAVHHWLEI
ncbi:trehalose-phosphatase [Qipengyuania qiaonensis]|uniref:Trehalose 6-phosphate phosphatase n=1 Tax=Qipengyuania qiaonensis TaxID=2867240 RepID=A0ABS7J5H1_9SPHN|nr:trehalose-phosphatase [Qipengyuania qiaonensis]MBX7482587.1 trehalose-phosphatase [Qipengyuania qiaonensis]